LSVNLIQDHWGWRYPAKSSALTTISPRAPFLQTIAEGHSAGVFALTVTPDDIIDLLLAALGGAMIPRVLRFPNPSADRFRTTLLRQVASMLGHE
jgi:hypothetical protein